MRSRVGRASRVVLVEKEGRLGGAPILSGYAKLVPSGEWAKDAIGGMVERVVKDPLSKCNSARRSKLVRGQPGGSRAQLSDGTHGRGGRGDARDRLHALRLASTSPSGASAPIPDVVTTTQVEQMISSGKGVRCPSDGRKPKRVAILLCVGSRDRQIGREWCSKICCTVSANMAMEIREELPGLPRLHLLHGHPHLRAVRDQVLLEEPGGVQGQVHQGAHRRGDVATASS